MICVNVDSPNLGLPYFNFLGEGQWKNTLASSGLQDERMEKVWKVKELKVEVDEVVLVLNGMMKYLEKVPLLLNMKDLFNFE